MSDLREELQSIDGVGDATADKILDVLDGYDTAEDPLLAKAKTAATEGNTHKAMAYLQRL